MEAKTGGTIKDIISAPPDPQTRLMLVNAIYFKGAWAVQFEKSDTTPMPFYLSESTTIQVPMTRQASKFGYGEKKSLQVLELPYVGNELSMVVILPTKIDGLRSLEENLTMESLDRWTTNLSSKRVEVYLPRFTMTSEIRLDDTLKAMGKVDAFDEGKADFSGMDGKPNWLYIGAVVHKAFVDVNEEGTEAAAVTGVRAGVKSAPPEPVLFRADHPFVYLIRENAARSILFMGRVGAPSTH